jgi:RsiW-degrading membrane proteinase PrsW (M82 family)
LVIMGFVDLVTIMNQDNNMWGKEASKAIDILFWFVIEVVFIGGLLLVNYVYRNRRVKTSTYYVLVVTCLVGILSCYVISILEESNIIPNIFPPSVV